MKGKAKGHISREGAPAAQRIGVYALRGFPRGVVVAASRVDNLEHNRYALPIRPLRVVYAAHRPTLLREHMFLLVP